MAQNTNDSFLQQIQVAWDEAQAQLKVLREQVERLNAVAQAKVVSNVLSRDMDRAYRDLGEAVWAEISKGRLQLGSNFAGVKKALEQVTSRVQAQNESINELLAEGAEAVQRLTERPVASSKTPAPFSSSRTPPPVSSSKTPAPLKRR